MMKRNDEKGETSLSLITFQNRLWLHNAIRNLSSRYEWRLAVRVGWERKKKKRKTKQNKEVVFRAENFESKDILTLTPLKCLRDR